jgi:hypothetical protein
MALPRPHMDWSIRNVLLLVFMFVWGVNVLAGVYRGERPSSDDYGVLGFGLGTIMALFKGGPPPPPREGGPS